MDNHTKQTDPSVEYLVQMFSEEFLRDLAQKTGFIKRIRKIDPVIFFWVLTLGFGVDFLRSIRALERRYETKANIEPGRRCFIRPIHAGTGGVPPRMHPACDRISGAAAI